MTKSFRYRVSASRLYVEDDVLRNSPDWAVAESVDCATGSVLLSVHRWLVKSPHHTILIDTGIGNDKNRPTMPMMDHLQDPYLDRLAEAGVEPAAVDYVLITHLHADHVGWNARRSGGQWIPAFPNARYVFSAGMSTVSFTMQRLILSRTDGKPASSGG